MSIHTSRKGKVALVFLLGTLLFGYGAFTAFAVPPVSPYAPGAVLDPACAPGSPNCTVKVWYDLFAENFSGTYLVAAPNASGSNAIALGDGSVSSGINSIAIGNGVTASGDFSMAFGDNSSATNDDAVVMGVGSTASGDTAFAFGNTTLASGDFSFALGNGAVASNTNAVALGGPNTGFGLPGPQATGENSLASGPGAVASALGSVAFMSGTASGISSFAFGNVEAAGLLSFAMGGGTAPDAQGDYSFFFGNGGEATGNEAITFSGVSSGDYSFSVFGNATGEGAVAMGTSSVVPFANAPQASGDHSFAANSGSVASGDFATAFGISTASGLAAMTWGDSNTASNQSATAFGSETTASGQSAVSWGFQTDATGLRATAWGDQTLASAIRATAFGQGTTASNDNATAFGQGSIASGTRSTAFGNLSSATGDTATAFGWVTSAPSLGEVAVGVFTTAYTPDSTVTPDPDDRAFVVGNGVGIGSESDAFTILKSGKVGIDIDNFEDPVNQILPITAKLQVSGDIAASGVVYANNVALTSDERYKENIENITFGLDTVLDLRPVAYDMRRDGSHQFGFIAQEIQDQLPDLVYENEYLSLNYIGIIPVLTKAIQELNDKVNMVSAGTVTGTSFGELFIDILHANRVETQEFCIDGTCIGGDEFRQLLDNNDIDAGALDEGDDESEVPAADDVPPESGENPVPDPAPIPPSEPTPDPSPEPAV